MSKKFGIDISAWQKPESINYDKLAKQIDFAILRVGYTGHGTGVSLHKDEAFDKHYAELHRRGIPLGVYWYSCANTPDKAIQEAKKCLEFIQGKELLYPVFMDVEDTYHQQPSSAITLTDSVIAFCETIENAGYYVGIYSSTWWFHNEMELNRLSPYDLWVAQWNKSEPEIRKGIWQYSSKGKLDGYNGNLDCNYSYKDYPAIMKANGLNGFKKSVATASKSYPDKKTEVKPAPMKPKTSKKTNSYKVKAGDTLWSIAEQFLGDGSKYPEIKSFNGLNSDLIRVGQVLKIPTENTDFKVGDTVRITAKRYTTGELIPDWVKNKTHKICEFSEGKVLLGYPDGIASWVAIDGIERA